MWNYAQHYAMSDHAFSTTFGPSTPGAINLVSGQTHGVKEFNADGTPATTPAAGDYTVRFPDAHGVGTMTGDPDPVYDDCSNNSHAKSYTLAAMTGRNIGDLLDAKKVVVGLVPGRLHADDRRSRRGARLVPHHAHERRRGELDRLQPAPRALPVLRVDGEPAPPAAGERCRDRP